MQSSVPVTSFRKKGHDAINIPGTTVSFQNAQLLTSIGSSTLDFFIGGGLAIGTVCLIEEDRYNSYSSLLLKYFLAEGVTRNHSVFLASGEKDPNSFIKNLPAAKSVEFASSFKPVDNVEDSLKIAWRYKNKTLEDTIKAESHNVGFDLSKTMAEEVLEKCSIATWDPTDLDNNEDQSTSFLKMPYSDLYNKIKSEIETKGFKTSTKRANNIMRIGINSIASPLWQNSSDHSQDMYLIRFLYVLKALLRTSFAVAVITIPSLLFTNIPLISRLRQMGDIVISLESFVGSSKKSNPLFKDFDGLLHIRKLPVLNTFTYPSLTQDLAFKLKRKGLLIERLHLPPELEDPSPEQQAQFGCSSLGKKLDF